MNLDSQVKLINSTRSILNAQRILTPDQFIAKYTYGQPTHNLSADQIANAIQALASDFPSMKIISTATKHNNNNATQGEQKMASAAATAVSFNGASNGAADSSGWSKIESSNEFKKATELKEGESVEGTLMALVESTKYPGKLHLQLKGADGKVFTLLPAGTINYNLKDGLFVVGKTYRITRTGTMKVKGMNTSQFEVFQKNS